MIKLSRSIRVSIRSTDYAARRLRFLVIIIYVIGYNTEPSKRVFCHFSRSSDSDMTIFIILFFYSHIPDKSSKINSLLQHLQQLQPFFQKYKSYFVFIQKILRKFLQIINLTLVLEMSMKYKNYIYILYFFFSFWSLKY